MRLFFGGGGVGVGNSFILKIFLVESFGFSTASTLTVRLLPLRFGCLFFLVRWRWPGFQRRVE